MLTLVRSEKAGVVLGRFIDAAGSLVFLKLLTGLATKDEVGKYLLASSVLAFVLTMSYSALDQGLLRNVTDYRRDGVLAPRYSAVLVFYLCTAGLLMAILLPAFGGVDESGTIGGLTGPMALWLTFEAAKNLNNSMHAALRERFKLAWTSMIEHGSKLVLLGIFFHLASLTVDTLVLVLALASTVTTLFSAYLLRSFLVPFELGGLRSAVVDALRFAWPMIIWGSFGWFHNMSSRWFIGHYLDMSSVAEYGVLMSIATFPVVALFGVVVTYIVPIIYEKEHEAPGRAKPFVKRVAGMMILPCLMMFLVASLWHEDIVLLLSGAGYGEKSFYLPVLLAATCIYYLGSIMTYSLYAKRKVPALLLANTLPGLLGLALGFYMIKDFGFEGAVLSYSITNVVACILYILAYAKN